MKSLPFAEFWEQHENYRLIDVREENEYAEVHVKGAELHPLSKIQNGEYPEIDDRPTALICKMGGRSAMACEILERAGLGEFTNIDGGTMAAVNMGEDVVER